MAMLVQPDLANAPYRALAEKADVALGTVAKCMNDLALRGLVLDRQGERTLPDRPALLALWVQAYVEALRPTLAERRLQMRADDKPQIWARLQAVLGERGQRWALTGADAAVRRDHYFRADQTEIYAPVRLLDDREVQKALEAQPAARGGNVLVIEPPGPLATAMADVDAMPIAPDLLAYAELRYRGTDQALEAAEFLLPECWAMPRLDPVLLQPIVYAPFS
ncbi:MAG: type IV toxin-antitoxin system AbiEi family antitoxin [Vicinamibacteraceae bacterium]